MVSVIPSVKKFNETVGFCKNTNEIEFCENEDLNKEAYILTVGPQGVKIEFSEPSGRFYAKKTLEQLKILYDNSVPCMEIEDSPAFEHRGFMIDSSRHFVPVYEIKKIIDVASSFKFNRFHWHLSDDQGFRIELEKFNELTAKGSVRNGDSYRNLPQTNEPYGGYYTKDEIRDIVAFAKSRFIEIIPEIDLPGHTSAILHTYPELGCTKQSVEIKTKEGIFKDILCAGNEKTYNFVFELLDEVSELFPFEYFHIGGDEAPKDNWKACPECQKKMRELGLKSENDLQVYFGNKIAEHLKNKEKKAIMWNDILKGKGLDKEITVQRWMDIKNVSVKETNSGRKTIASNFKPYYCDYPYEMYPLKKVYTFNPLKVKGLTAEGAKNIIGVESPVWLEFIDTDDRLEYLIFPRWFAVADTAWSGNENKNYAEFKSSCKLICNYLKQHGVTPAEEKEWDKNIFSSLKGTVKFFVPKK